MMLQIKSKEFVIILVLIGMVGIVLFVTKPESNITTAPDRLPDQMEIKPHQMEIKPDQMEIKPDQMEIKPDQMGPFAYKPQTLPRVSSDDSPLLIPDDVTINQMSAQQSTDLLWRYINTIQVLCRNQLRLGSIKDGGKEICIDSTYAPGKPCLVYSFGSNFQTDFEEATIRIYGCEMHTFDPTRPLNKNFKMPTGIEFHLLGLAGKDGKTNKNWEMRTLSTIVKELNHTNRMIDILKIDIENGEWDSIPEILLSGVFRQVKQIQLEIHLQWNVGSNAKAMKVLRLLYEHGFYIFMREHNINCVAKDSFPQRTSCNELSFINVCLKQNC